MSKESKINNSGRLTKVLNNVTSIPRKTGEKIGIIPELAKGLFKTSDKSEENQHKLIKQDKDFIHKIMNDMRVSGNYTNEEMHEYLEKSMKLNKDSEGMIDKLNKHRAVILPIVATSLTTVLIEVIKNNNKK